jgi:uncharacterized protein YhfF
MGYQKSILTDNIISILTETITGKEFENMNIVWIKTNDGSYEVLFDSHGEPVQEITNVVSRLEEFFKKDFNPAFFEGQNCLIHINR